MDFGLVIAVVMLVGWALWTFLADAPGWAHIFLSIGFFLLIYRMVARDTPGFPSGKDKPAKK